MQAQRDPILNSPGSSKYDFPLIKPIFTNGIQTGLTCEDAGLFTSFWRAVEPI
jgi:hypothetical protein